MKNAWILLPVLVPAVTGAALAAASFREHLAGGNTGPGDQKGFVPENTRGLHALVGTVLVLSALVAVGGAWLWGGSLTLFPLVDGIPLYFQIDDVGRLFVTVVSLVWLAAAVYAFSYMEKEGDQKRFFGFYLLVYAILVGQEFAGNLLTMYLFYELMTLASVPLVLHSGTREAVMAALKYLFYSLCGAYLGLFGIYTLSRFCDTLAFQPGGSLNPVLAQGNRGLLLAAMFATVLGFGAKAGMLPLHGWLPTAHPQAPSPASAVLSGVIVKSGVLAILRAEYYVAGPDLIRGSWVQEAWMILALATVFMGSLLAFREPVLKKRLAYSTVSQVSYILFGLALLAPTAMEGALLHVVFHAVVKCALFLSAGVLLSKWGITRVEELAGLGKKQPLLVWSYTLASLALIGIPPASGFVSKWYLAQGALESQTGVFRYLGPAVLLVSAFLTAGYLLPVTVKAFFPGESRIPERFGERVDMRMLAPLAVLALLAVLMGPFPGPVLELTGRIAALAAGR